MLISKFVSKKILILLGFTQLLTITSCCNKQKTYDAENAIEIISKKLKETGPFNVKKLKGGISGAQIFLIENEKRKFVVRFLVNKSADLVKSEIECLKIAESEGYGPKIYFSDPNNNVVVMEFLENQELPASFMQSEQFYLQLAELLHKIHRGPKFPTTTNIFDKINKNIAIVLSSKNKDVPVDKLQQILNIIFSALKPHLTEKPCHFDLGPNNIFITKDKITVIDFETASQGEPFYDVARMAESYCSNADQENILLKAYLGHNPSKKDLALLFLMKHIGYIDGATELLKMNIKDIEYYSNASSEKYEIYFTKIQKAFANGSLDPNSKYFQIDTAKVLINHVFSNFNTEQFKKAVKDMHVEN